MVRQNRLQHMREQFAQATKFRQVGEPYSLHDQRDRDRGRYHDRQRDYGRSKSRDRDRDYRTSKDYDRRRDHREREPRRDAGRKGSSGKSDRDYQRRNRDRDDKHGRRREHSPNDRRDHKDRSGHYQSWQKPGQSLTRHNNKVGVPDAGSQMPRGASMLMNQSQQ